MPGTVSETAIKALQPKGGYLPPKSFTKRTFPSDEELHEKENLSPILIGIVVDSMTRFMLTGDFYKSFATQIRGIRLACGSEEDAASETVDYVLGIKGLDEASIIKACELAVYETWYRNTAYAKSVNLSPDEIEPDEATIENIRVMVERSVQFFTDYGPVVSAGFNFFPEDGSFEKWKEQIKQGNRGKYGGYTITVPAGDGDYLTKDGLWDMKVSRGKLTSKQTLQIFMYLIMGVVSEREEFQGISRFGIFNPRQNVAYVKEVRDLDKDVMIAVARDVIKY